MKYVVEIELLFRLSCAVLSVAITSFSWPLSVVRH